MVRQQQLEDNYKECELDECDNGLSCYEHNGLSKECKTCLCLTCVRACYQCKEQTGD